MRLWNKYMTQTKKTDIKRVLSVSFEEIFSQQTARVSEVKGEILSLTSSEMLHLDRPLFKVNCAF